ncbi:MAG: UDP-N-acetylmuramoyl-L-alanyl-D-glutamate--2,6-diaminopimelate ligase [Proteobacteria bacterium]|nr:UDP-N-acetylmuramoyl-L-alanyl-D-glutamate--2,6-diaminopimelate ligase [Pseudomonadota bacterium]
MGAKTQQKQSSYLMVAIDEHESISLASLLAGITFVDPIWDRGITGLANDSRQVKPGDLFIACVGQHTDGRQYINNAIEKGAQAILVENAEQSETPQKMTELNQDKIPIFYIDLLTQQIGKIAARFYGHPSRQMKIVGITGTNGKTSCSHFIATILTQLNHPCAVIGTLGYGMIGALQSTGFTTPDAISLQTAFANLKKQNIEHVAMEVSSHALDQGRVKQVEFKIAVFTNLTHDHLDYHGTFEAYGAAKKILFDQFGLSYAVINQDDPFGQSLLKQLPSTVKGFSYSILDKHADIYAYDLKLHPQGMEAKVKTPWGEGIIKTQLLGSFNLSNLLATLGSVCLLDVPFTDALAAMNRLQGIDGRMQIIKTPEHPTAVIDYSHTPDSLEKALLALREHCEGKIWCVFGCGGDRDQKKRPIMGEIAEKYADKIVITNDNPRHESPDFIISGILSGIHHKDQAIIEQDRKRAIAYALSKADKNDVILIAGKGHEDYQIVGDEHLPFSDKQVVQELMNIQ